MITIDFTYQTVTPESAEHGDFDEHGFILPGMWKFPTKYDNDGKLIDNYTRVAWERGNLAGFIDFARSLGITANADADWFYSVDPDIDYQTGSETQYAMHIDGATPSTINRIARLLNA